MKKALSLLLAIVMVIGMLPMAALAAETGGKITFTTDFTNDMGVGDIFIVTATLSENPGIASFTNQLKWNSAAVEFLGFKEEYSEDDEDYVIVSDIFTAAGWSYVTNLNGTFAAARDNNRTKTGTLYVGEFKIIAEEGALNLGLTTTEFGQKFTFANADGTDIMPELDFSAISGLTVGGKAPGATIPDDAPFTAVTTDAGAAIEIQEEGEAEVSVWGASHAATLYNVVVPAGATYADITLNMPTSNLVIYNEGGAAGYYGPAAGGEGNGASFEVVSSDSDSTTIRIPMEMTVTDWSGNTDSFSLVKNEDGDYYVAGPENAAFAAIAYFSFEYAEGGEPDVPDVPAHTCTFAEVVAAEFLKSEATCESGAVYYKSCTCGKMSEETFVSGETVDHIYVDGACKWCGVAEPVQTPGYRFATSADVSTVNDGNAVVKVKITGHSDENITSYNAYDVTLTFDSDKLEYVGYDGAVKSDNGSVTVEGNTIRIVGCGADKGFGTEIAALTFKTKAEGNANVTIDKVQVSDKEESVKEDAPEATPKHDENDSAADETPDVSVVIVPYSVTKPDFVSGNDKILHGETYTFSYTDTTNYTYSGLTVTVGGVAVENLVADENGVYTIENVTGAIEITATQTPNSYDVTKPDNVTGPDKATYGEDYIFTVTPSEEGMVIDTVTVKYADGSEVPCTINDNGKYEIAGTDITGAFTITVTEKEPAPTKTKVTFRGIEESEIVGGLTQEADIGKAFTFQLNKVEGFKYTVKVGETELTESKETAGQYTIPAEKVVKGGVQVDITKEDNTRPVVDVAEYINLDGKTMFLVTAKWGEKILAYGENTMFYSGKYTVTGETEAGAYCWLVLSTDEMNTVDLVKAAAEAAIVEAAEGATVTAVKYNYDINGTTKVDVNDAQLAYDMYNASYMEFSENLPMLKFLEADMETDAKLDTKDVAAIISYIVSGANA